MRYRDLRGVLATSVAVMAVAVATPAVAQVRTFDIPAQSAATGLPALAKQADIQLLVSADAVAGKSIRAVKGRMTVDEAIQRVVSDTNLRVITSDGRTYTLSPRDVKRPQSSLRTPVYQAAQAPQNDTDIIVTAQKKEERITDVPIAMTALSADALDDYKIEGGSELLRAIPNVNFSKSNFSMYNFSIRGVGTKATSASSDPAVAISFNNTPLVRNRLFEAEFIDMQRIEVLRGPQGTLYGRNATGGVVNLISALPTDDFGGEIKGETGNYNSRRLSGMLNVPLTDTLGIRVAGAMTKRDGYDYNTFTENRVNGRDLWSTRVTVGWEPSDNFRANFIWQHFEEDDNRSRTGKNLCTRDPGPESISGIAITDPAVRGRFSQGCLPRSLYDDAAYGAPNGYSLTYYVAPSGVSIGRDKVTRRQVTMIKVGDPFGSVVQSRNLREIETSYDPVFRANNDVLQLNMDLNIGSFLKLSSQSLYSEDDYYSSQDYNRFVTDPLFNDSLLVNDNRNRPLDPLTQPGATPGGMFCDPQLGCSDRMLSVDISKSNSKQWYQEFRLQSEFDGPINFNIGANYLKFKSQDKYYVFNNFFTLIAQYFYGEIDPSTGLVVPQDCPLGFEGRECIYVDPNSIDKVNDQGHNYFLSNNYITTKSKSLFGELYTELNDNLKITTGLRYTDDFKDSSQIPSQLMLGGGTDGPNPGSNTGGRVNSGYPALPNIRQSWKEFTGRLVVDWKPDVSFSDDTLIYASLSRGYKGGGTNPPRVDMNPDIVQYLPLDTEFKPERVNAFEIGTKNSFFNNKLSVNLTAFYYKYKDYQISQIVDRIAYNENFDAENMGLEVEAVWRASRNFKFDANLGFLKTKISDGESSIDVMNRTQGNSDWVLLRPWLQAPSNCVAPRVLVEKILASSIPPTLPLAALCPGGNRLGDFNPATSGGANYDTLYGFTYDPLRPYNPDTVGLDISANGSGAPNGGRGFAADLSGNSLPNSPSVTFNIGGEFRSNINNSSWMALLRADYYFQSKSYSRIYNSEFDRIRSWDNVNLSASLINQDYDLEFMIYVKNLFNKDSITDAFTNADDTGLSANVFLVDPRIIGFSIKKIF